MSNMEELQQYIISNLHEAFLVDLGTIKSDALRIPAPEGAPAQTMIIRVIYQPNGTDRQVHCDCKGLRINIQNDELVSEVDRHYKDLVAAAILGKKLS